MIVTRAAAARFFLQKIEKKTSEFLFFKTWKVNVTRRDLFKNNVIFAFWCTFCEKTNSNTYAGILIALEVLEVFRHLHFNISHYGVEHLRSWKSHFNAESNGGLSMCGRSENLQLHFGPTNKRGHTENLQLHFGPTNKRFTEKIHHDY